MNVCLLNDSFPPVIDGVANTVMNYARILSEEDLAGVTVATPEYPGADYSGYPYRVVPYSSFSIGNLVSGYRAGNPLDVPAIEQLVAFSPDIIHSHCPVVSTMMARSLKMRTKAPLIFTYHTKFDVDIARAVKNRFLQKEAAKALVDNIEACDEVWTVSRGAGENLKSLGYEGEYRVVLNGVDFPRGKAEVGRIKETVSGYDLPEGVPVYLFVGRIINYKGLPIIMDALKRVRDGGQDFRMVFIGGGPDLEDLRQKADEYALSDKVIFTGPVHDREALRAWNTRADLFLFPSTYDTNGIVVREAAACGLASVLVRDSCASEGITDGRNGFFIDENDESLAELLLELGSDIDRMRDTGDHAMNEIYISWEESVRHAYDLYGEVMENNERGVYQSGLARRFEEIKEGTRESAARREERWNDMIDNLEEMHEERRNEVMESLEQIRDGRWSEILAGMEHIHEMHYEGMLENIEQFRSDIRRAGEEVEKFGRDAWKRAKILLYGEDGDE
ncbi:MAG: glycosyltransferase [Lachnospiraceae bacterium]|nr:glycosyltransferase [Lachnospiraceae bacterium]